MNPGRNVVLWRSQGHVEEEEDVVDGQRAAGHAVPPLLVALHRQEVGRVATWKGI